MTGKKFNMDNKLFLSFILNSSKYAIDISYVIEIKSFDELNLLPLSGPPYVKGCVIFRDKITPIIDLEVIYQQKGVSFLSRDSIIFVLVEEEYIGIITKGIPNIIELSEDNISFDKLDNSLEEKGIKAIGIYYDEPYYIIDLAKLLLNNEVGAYRGENGTDKSIDYR